MNGLQTSKPSQKLDKYIFTKDIISIEGDVDTGGKWPSLTLNIPNYDSSMVLCLLKDNLVKDEVWEYLNNQEQEKITSGLSIQPYKRNYFFRYKMPDTGKIITITCGEWFLIDYYTNKDFKNNIKELKKIAVELKEVKNEQ